MKKLIIILFLFFSLTLYGQEIIYDFNTDYINVLNLSDFIASVQILDVSGNSLILDIVQPYSFKEWNNNEITAGKIVVNIYFGVITIKNNMTFVVIPDKRNIKNKKKELDI